MLEWKSGSSKNKTKIMNQLMLAKMMVQNQFIKNCITSCINFNWTSIGENTNDCSISCANSNDCLCSKNLNRNRSNNNDHNCDYAYYILIKLIDKCWLVIIITVCYQQIQIVKKLITLVSLIIIIYIYKCNESYLHETRIHYCTNNILSISGTLCCLGRAGCAYYNVIQSIIHLVIITFIVMDVIHVQGQILLIIVILLAVVHLQVVTIVIQLMNSDIVIWCSQARCSNSKITNVCTVVAAGYFAMYKSGFCK